MSLLSKPAPAAHQLGAIDPHRQMRASSSRTQFAGEKPLTPSHSRAGPCSPLASSSRVRAYHPADGHLPGVLKRTAALSNAPSAAGIPSL